MNQLIKGILLLIVSIILVGTVTIVTFGVSIFYYLFSPYMGAKKLGEWFYLLALSIDQFGNVSCAAPLKYAMTKEGGFSFGDPDHTVSYVLGKNKAMNTLTWFGVFICIVLNWIDKDHVEKAVELNEGV